MKVVYNWLKDFVDVTAPSQELASRLALSGTNIGGIEHGPHGAVIEAEVSSNRPDCLGHLGIAREVGAIYKQHLVFTPPRPEESPSAKASDAVKVEIQSPELCGRFTARVIRNVKIQPSPKWLKDRLEASGVASISNVVDVSNYVMLELGHPLHTFDYDKVRDHKIVVRRAKQNEKIKTLDAIDRQLDSNICMISDGDGSRAVGIGGIMGGAETEISFSTKNVLIECAWFEPIAIRRAARFLKLHTEASTRFGRGADPEMAELASRRAAELILQLAGGELLSGVVDVYPGKRTPKKLRVTRAEILRVMGADVPDKEVEASLSALGFAPVRIDQNRGAEGSLLAAWECTQPSWRAEVEREIDLIEEIARIYGLDKFPPRLPAARQGAARLPHFEAETRLRERLIGLGYREILTIPHVAEERDALFRPGGISPARLSNPLSEEANVLRSTGLVTMAAALEWNLNHGQRNARLFEIGSHYRLNGAEPAARRAKLAKKIFTMPHANFPSPISKAISIPSANLREALRGATADRSGCTRRGAEVLRLARTKSARQANSHAGSQRNSNSARTFFLRNWSSIRCVWRTVRRRKRGAMSHCRASRRSSGTSRCSYRMELIFPML